MVAKRFVQIYADEKSQRSIFFDMIKRKPVSRRTGEKSDWWTGLVVLSSMTINLYFGKVLVDIKLEPKWLIPLIFLVGAIGGTILNIIMNIYSNREDEIVYLEGISKKELLDYVAKGERQTIKYLLVLLFLAGGTWIGFNSLVSGKYKIFMVIGSILMTMILFFVIETFALGKRYRAHQYIKKNADTIVLNNQEKGEIG